jgi:hypothetical protein
MISGDDIEAFREEGEPPVKVGDMATVAWSPYVLQQGMVIAIYADGQVLLDGAESPGFLVGSSWRVE